MKFLTFLNYGCFDICLNMLKSAENVGIKMEDFIIACMDNASHDAFKSKGYENAFLHIDQEIKEYQDWTFDGNSGFRKIVKHKWNLINEVHKKHPNLMWVDTDIVFKKNPVELLSGHKEVLFQTDSPGSRICTGFMVFNETPECRKLIEECSLYHSDDDQLIMNHIGLSKYRQHIKLLSKELFPNGRMYYQENKKENAMIVHNNWMVGVENKILKFREEGLWFI